MRKKIQCLLSCERQRKNGTLVKKKGVKFVKKRKREREKKDEENILLRTFRIDEVSTTR